MVCPSASRIWGLQVRTSGEHECFSQSSVMILERDLGQFKTIKENVKISVWENTAELNIMNHLYGGAEQRWEHLSISIPKVRTSA